MTRAAIILAAVLVAAWLLRRRRPAPPWDEPEPLGWDTYQAAVLARRA